MNRSRRSNQGPLGLGRLPGGGEPYRAEQAKKTLAREPGYALSDLVLAAPRGGPWWPYNFDRMWRKFKAKQGLEMAVGRRRTAGAQARVGCVRRDVSGLSILSRESRQAETPGRRARTRSGSHD